MSNACDSCGFRSSEVKGGGPISDKGSSWTVQVQEPDDLQRDVIKAETASISIPELDFEVTSGEIWCCRGAAECCSSELLKNQGQASGTALNVWRGSILERWW